MRKLNLSRRDVLKQIEAGTLSSVEGLRLIQQLSEAATTSQAERPTSVLEVFRPEWVRSDAASSGPRSDVGHIVVFDNDETICRRLRKELHRVVLVKPGRTFSRLQTDIYEIDPRNSDDYRRLFQDLETAGVSPAKILYLWTRSGAGFAHAELTKELNLGVFSVFSCSKALLELKLKNRIDLFYIYRNDQNDFQPQHAALSSFGRSLRQEQPNFRLRTIALDTVAGDDCAAILLREFGLDDAVEINYRNNERYVRRLKAEPSQAAASSAPFRANGVYVITGGVGGLGTSVAEHLAHEKAVRLVLTGRSPLNAQQTAWLKQLNTGGNRVTYLQADISRRDDVERLLSETRKRFGSISGIIHCAGITRDAFLHKKSLADVTAVLAPKVNGTVWLDELSRNDQLDFFVLFSSVAAIFGSVGQCDYAFANGFLDAFAEWRNSLRDKQERSGRTFSINWPLWRDGGMSVDESTQRSLAEAGIESLSTADGLRTFDTIVSTNASQHIVLFGQPESLRRLTDINRASSTEATSASSVESPVDKASLLEAAEAFLKQTLASEAKLPLSKIRSQEPLENLGIDSLLIMTLTRELEKVFGELPKTLFFEYQTLAELSEYFVDRHPSAIQKLTATSNKPRPQQSAAVRSTKEPVKPEPAAPRVNSGTLDVAIIGLSGRYPMADDLAAFWENLKNGKDCITEIPTERWDHSHYFDTNKKKPGKSYSKWGGFVNDVDKFDPLFFNISPAEAELIDPQERLFLETVWQTFEDASYTRQQLSSSRTGVFVGVMYGQYQLFSAENALAGDTLVFGSSYASIANRASYFFNLKGPSIALDTMCSSSLTAIHLACSSIWQGECKLAIAGGVNLSVHPQKYQLLSQGRFAATDGRCRSFGDGGDGYVPGEGVGAVLLKPLGDAIADRDHIYGVIKGSSINHGGKTNGYTVPNPKAQAELITDALKNANLEPSRISYIEAHGTGTSLGDPIEIAGLTKAFESDRGVSTELVKPNSCPIGSVKSNIGHLESAAGIAAVTKVLLQFKHQQLVPSLHSKQLNPNLNLGDTPFFVQQELAQWQQPKTVEGGVEKYYPRQAGVSGFGAGGANAHLILEEYVDDFSSVEGVEAQPHIVVLSARTRDSLKRYANKLLDFLTGRPQEPTPHHAGNSEDLLAEVQQNLVKLAAKLVQVTEQEIDPEDTLRELGFDWMSFATLVDQIGETYRCDVDPALLPESTTVAELARHVVDRCAGKLETSRVESLEADAAENPVSLADLAYTLQVGREAMKERLAIVTSGKRELCEKLKSYCDDNGEQEHVYIASFTPGAATPERLVEGRTGEKFIKLLIEDREWDKVAQLWVSGVEINWSLLHEKADGPNLPKRISLPTYQFARERYWAPAPLQQPSRLSQLHPLIHRNNSSLRETRFTTHLQSEDAYLIEHAGKRCLPSLAVLEMVKAAGEIAEPRKVQKLKDVVWGSPIAVNDSVELQVTLHPERAAVRFEVSSSSETGELIVHSQGVVVYEVGSAADEHHLDLDAIKLRCSDITSGGQKQVVSDLFVGADEALARLVLPEESATTFFMHPALLDGVLHSSSLWLSAKGESAVSTTTPLRLAESEFKQPLGNVVYAHLKSVDSRTTSVSEERDLKVDLTDESGRSLVQLSGLSVAFPTTRTANVPASKQPLPVSTNKLSTRQQLEHDIQRFAADLIKITPDQLEVTAGLGEFGFESVTFVELGEKLNQHLNIELSPTIFFERDTVRSLAEYLEAEFGQQVQVRYASLQNSPSAVAATVIETVNVTPALVPFSKTFRKDDELEQNREAIAIVGISGVFPGSRDLNHFWENLKSQKDLITEIPAERWKWRDYHKDFSSGEFKTQVKWGGFIKDADKFDARFFSISPLEAEMMDPQQRVFLETVWKTIEDAGYRASEFAGRRVGLFVGVQFSDYQQMLASQGLLNAQMGLGNEHSILVNRISYLLNLRGPSEPYNTACSSSLVAVHRAVSSIRSGESELAIAGGISLMLSPYTTISGDSLGVLSVDGRCKTLDASANGYVRGEGVGALLLKPLSRALADNDHIYAVIKATAVNHGGKAPSLTAPNSEAQAALLVQAYEDADLAPESISYLELHGTGTKLGDPIEIEGIKRAFKQLGERRQQPVQRTSYCGIGSVKTNIGHLEPASGIAGLMKLILSMQHRTLPGIVHLNELNPYVKLEQTPFYIVDETRPWKQLIGENQQPLPRRAGVSSFGFGGVNAHVVLEEFESPARNFEGTRQLFVLSAKTEERLQAYSETFVEFLNENAGNVSLIDLAYTLQVGREEFVERLAVVATSVEELRDKLVQYLEASPTPQNVYRGKAITKSGQAASERDQERLNALIANQDLDRLATQWIAGAKIDWVQLHINDTPRRVSLPTYPFERKRYWALKDGAPLVSLKSAALSEEPKISLVTDCSDDPVLHELRGMFAEELKTDITSLELDTDFTEFGVDSILASVIVQRIRERYGDTITLTAIVEHPTLRELTAYVREEGHQEQVARAPQPTPFAKPVRAVSQFPPELVPLNLKGTQQTSFWVHGGVGYAALYANLSRSLGPDYPFYAFQARGVDGKSIPHDFEEMIAHYTHCIRLAQPKGPYVIGGYSYGGLVAYEIARRMHLNGDKISRLVLFDTLPSVEEAFQIFLAQYGADDNFLTMMMGNEFAGAKKAGRPLITMEDIEKVPEKLRVGVVSRLAKERGQTAMSADEIYNYIRGSIKLCDYTEATYRSYRAEPYEGSDLLYFKAQKFLSVENWIGTEAHDIFRKYDYIEPWRQLVKGEVSVVHLPCDHFNMLEEPALSTSVEHVRACLNSDEEHEKQTRVA
jgi:acyl transferase domain-containing protein/thioesterase domain-containing protein/NAD(P)-dependent dehydrogenase (short-subunit alcohol dehydrogenase family)/aryl carrier-like protein